MNGKTSAKKIECVTSGSIRHGRVNHQTIAINSLPINRDELLITVGYGQRAFTLTGGGDELAGGLAQDVVFAERESGYFFLESSRSKSPFLHF